MKLTEEQYNTLKKYEKHLRRGFYGDYTYGLYQKDFDEMLAIYKELGGNERLKYSCNVCCLRLTKFLGKLYFEWVPEQNPIPVEVVEAVLQEKIEDEPEEKPKKKRVRKSKIMKDGEEK